MTKTDFVKKAVSFVAGAGTTAIIKGIIDNNTNPENAIAKINIWIASAVIGGIAREIVTKYTDRWIDEVIAEWNEIRAKANEETPTE
jgi:hypothetical protein